MLSSWLSSQLGILMVIVLATLHLFAVKLSAQELITCHQSDGCTGTTSEGVTVQDCCDNVNGGGRNGIGLGSSYQQDGVGGCTPCPIG